VDCAVGEGHGIFPCATLGAAFLCSEYHIEAVDACLIGAPPISRAIHSVRVEPVPGVSYLGSPNCRYHTYPRNPRVGRGRVGEGCRLRSYF
jgi:hypothetical protein